MNTKVKRGRPKKTEMVSRERGKTGLSRGRPKGDAAIINEYKEDVVFPKVKKSIRVDIRCGSE